MGPPASRFALTPSCLLYNYSKGNYIPCCRCLEALATKSYSRWGFPYKAALSVPDTHLCCRDSSGHGRLHCNVYFSELHRWSHIKPQILSSTHSLRKSLLDLREFAWNLTQNLFLCHKSHGVPFPLIRKEMPWCSRNAGTRVQLCHRPAGSLPPLLLSSSLVLSASTESSLGVDWALNIRLHRIWCKQDSDLEDWSVFIWVKLPPKWHLSLISQNQEPELWPLSKLDTFLACTPHPGVGESHWPWWWVALKGPGWFCTQQLHRFLAMNRIKMYSNIATPAPQHLWKTEVFVH